MKKILPTLLGSILCSLIVTAQSARAQGTAFTYQGRLNDGANPANGVYDLTFTLFNAASGGAALGSYFVGDRGITNGLFSVTLDFGAGAFTGAERWLEIAVQTNGAALFTTVSPRQSLTAAPYAIYAGGVTASGINGTIAPANIGAGSLTTVMLAAGAVGSNQLAAGAVTTGALADGAVTAPKVATVSNWFAVTIPNPTPVADDFFGYSVAAVGSDRVLIGAYQDDWGAADVGAAYLFNTNGALLTNFVNPTAVLNDKFGWTVAALGNDRVLIGAYGNDTGATDAGAAYLFNTNGALLTTFTNPTPAASDSFGISVAAVGSDRVLIGAHGDNTGASDAGSAYLFSTNGTLLTTFTNPTPAANDYFGWSIAAVGSGRVLIGAYNDNSGGGGNVGAAYLFSTSGTLLTTITNPTPANGDFFGWSVAAVGSDRMLIGALFGNAGQVGAAYLFNLNGTLLTTFTNPTPATSDVFGISVAAVGSDRVLIGANRDDTGAADAGAAYLFSTDGTLLTTFTKPTPAANDFFGISVAAVGSDRVLIGAWADDTGALDSGAAYLFSTETYTPGLVAEAVRAGSVTTTSLAEGAVTVGKLDPTIGVWTRSGENVFRPSGNVGIGMSNPQAPFNVNGSARIDALPFNYGEGLILNLPTDMTGNGYGGIHFHNAARGDTLGAGTIKWSLFYNNSPEGGIAGGGLGFVQNNANTRLYLASGGNIGIGTTTPASALQVNGTVTATAFNPSSDRNLKENFTEVSPREILDKVTTLTVSRWNFKGDAATPHVGPMAQDFHAAFGLGTDNKHIATVDADGVALAAIQGLNQKVDSENAALREELKRRDAENAELKQRLEKLEQLMNRENGGAR